MRDIDVPDSPIVDRGDGTGITPQVGRELRRALAMVEVVYHCAPGEFIDIQAIIFDALHDAGVETNGIMGDPASVGVDLLSHVVLRAGEPAPEATSDARH